MQQIPLQPIPDQITKVVLDGQNTQIAVHQKTQGVFVDIALNGVAIVSSVLARDAVPLICRDYAGFSGNLMFIDTQGSNDPEYSGIGSRYQLAYLTASEYDLIR